MSRLTENENTSVLKGTALDIYRFMLKSNKPLGIRDVQRALKLSSPSVAQYHMSKLERAGLLKQENGNWVVNKVRLDNRVKVGRFLIPRQLFYAIFAVAILLGGFILFNGQTVISHEFFYFMTATLVFVLIFSYETVKVWLKGKL
ncbi:MAG: winged helix-turn-helix domain-containing protein [Candidatus Bathyarchaeota archaeon]|nr:winged helix-turn-helix domain-containing protein [Candidatus Bathyarchaeota archaeon]